MSTPVFSDSRIPWPRIVGELVVIVVGILIALAVDAGWSERAERIEEREALAELRAEFDDNAVQFDSIVRLHRTVAEAGATLFAFVRGEVELTPDSVARLVREVDQGWTYNPKTGALEALIASGRLGIIRDDDLRVALAGWSGLVDDYQEDERNAADFVSGPLFDHLLRVSEWSSVYPLGGGSVRVLDPARFEALRGDRTLADLLAYRTSWEDVILAESDQLRAGLDGIRRAIDEALEIQPESP